QLFFFQAEDGIRDRNVTGVQTCALPIWKMRTSGSRRGTRSRAAGGVRMWSWTECGPDADARSTSAIIFLRLPGVTDGAGKVTDSLRDRSGRDRHRGEGA